MAKLPKGGKPLSNSYGTAPGVMLKVDKTILISLPGVPLHDQVGSAEESALHFNQVLKLPECLTLRKMNMPT